MDKTSARFPRPFRTAALCLTLMAGLSLPACERTAPPPSEVATPAPATPPSPPPPAWAEIPPRERLHHGLDVSVHSGAVDWTRVASAGHTFVFVKATEGVDLKDPAFDDHWRQLRGAGLIRGAYHFYVTEDDPEEQARFFIANVVLEPGDLVPVVDIELIGHDTPAGLPDRLRAFLAALEGHYGVTPIIYTSPKFWSAHFGKGFERYPLWIAEYDTEAPSIPEGWRTWHLWQWRGDAEVPGVEKGADLSQVNRTGVDLTALFVPG